MPIECFAQTHADKNTDILTHQIINVKEDLGSVFITIESTERKLVLLR